MSLDNHWLSYYNKNMIKSFKHKGLEKFFLTGSLKGIQAIHKDRLSMILSILNAMNDLEPLKLPSLKLHKLKGNLSNLWSITVQANWRITFEFDDKTQDVYIVDYQDYH